MCGSSSHFLFKFMARLKGSSFYYYFAFGLGQIMHVSTTESLLIILC